MSTSHDHGTEHPTDEHDLFTVPPFVPEKSAHDYFLSFLALLTSAGLIYLMLDWSQMPLPGG